MVASGVLNLLPASDPLHLADGQRPWVLFARDSRLAPRRDARAQAGSLRSGRSRRSTLAVSFQVAPTTWISSRPFEHELRPLVSKLPSLSPQQPARANRQPYDPRRHSRLRGFEPPRFVLISPCTVALASTSAALATVSFRNCSTSRTTNGSSYAPASMTTRHVVPGPCPLRSRLRGQPSDVGAAILSLVLRVILNVRRIAPTLSPVPAIDQAAAHRSVLTTSALSSSKLHVSRTLADLPL